jgi:omega-6 fatty acid desaturase (delta-12 desaturase)
MGVSIFLFDYVVLFGLLASALLFNSIWLQLSCSLLAGVAIGALFVVGHDAAHNSLTPHRGLNRFLGYLSLLPALHPYSLWVLVHNQTHHRWTNLSPHDYVWTPLSRDQFHSLSPLKRFLYRISRGPLGQLTYYFLEFWLRRMIFPSRNQVRGTYKPEYVLDIAFVVICGAAYVAMLVIAGQQNTFGDSMTVGWNLSFGFGIPFAVWNVLMSTVIYLHHTHPRLRWYDDKDLWRSRVDQLDTAVHVIFPGPTNLIFHWIMEHNAHHARPSIPLYRLPAAQRDYEARECGRIIILKWTPAAHWDIVRRCKLYDFTAHRWTDFSGRYTSANHPEDGSAPDLESSSAVAQSDSRGSRTISES